MVRMNLFFFFVLVKGFMIFIDILKNGVDIIGVLIIGIFILVFFVIF